MTDTSKQAVMAMTELLERQAKILHTGWPETMRSAAALLRALLAEREWRTMDSAPRAPVDGPECWEVLCHWAGGNIQVAYHGKYGWWPTAYDSDEPWGEPTHWRPLPTPETSK